MMNKKFNLYQITEEPQRMEFTNQEREKYLFIFFTINYDEMNKDQKIKKNN
jgi:hypothetical protein